jgi:predicted O-methyltransferase YrrM
MLMPKAIRNMSGKMRRIDMVAVLAGIKDNHPCGKHHITAKTVRQLNAKFLFLGGMKEKLKRSSLLVIDLLLSPLNFIFLNLMRVFRHYGMQYFPVMRKLVQHTGILPLNNHYYQPQFIYSKDFDPERPRSLAIDMNITEQLQTLQALDFSGELNNFSRIPHPTGYYLGNGAFDEGDAELYYLMIRNKKPKRIIEIGSGHSTRVAHLALERNKAEGTTTEMTCIEPYENPWLESIPGVKIVRSRIEETDLSLFQSLEAGDMLFIDTSHVIRPENDVLHIYFEILPVIKPGVIIHIHDIFTPRHYPQDWTHLEFRFWNEQYLLEAMLMSGDRFGILFALNHLKKTEFNTLKSVLTNITPTGNPSSFWLESR